MRRALAYIPPGMLLCLAPVSCGASIPIDLIRLPPGFSISVFAGDVPGARSLALGDEGTLFVGTRQAGKVYGLRDADKDGKAEQRFVIASGLDMPNGVAFRGGALYVAEKQRILRFDGIEQRLEDPPRPVVVYDQLPGESHHGWRYMGFGPGDWLYVAVGAPCNVCDEPGFAEIRRLRPDGSKSEVYAQGVRNSVGFAWHPQDGALWFTDNGRDRLGDDLPPDELNRAPRAGMHFGFPFCHGRDTADPDFGRQRNCREFTPPARELGPHVAALGLAFYTGQQFPSSYRNQLFIAEHGSWNRSAKIGYRLTLVRLKGNEPVAYETFAEGWLAAGRTWGRPVDVIVAGDGALLVSDDMAGVIYRITYGGPPAGSP